MSMLKSLLQSIHLQRKIDSIGLPTESFNSRKKKKKRNIYIVAIKTLQGLNICIFMFRKFIKLFAESICVSTFYFSIINVDRRVCNNIAISIARLLRIPFFKTKRRTNGRGGGGGE